MTGRGEVRLDESDRALLQGEAGPGGTLAMELVLALARASGAERLEPIVGAHVDGCLYHGEAGIDFVRRLVDSGVTVSVPTTLNVSSLDLLHPQHYRGDPATAKRARTLMDLHVELGCRPTWTCAPYHRDQRPALGEQVAWGESNAIVFANSVLGARTNRYGDFADLACAVVGKVPFAGLHTDRGRLSTVAIDVDVPPSWLDHDLFYPLLGYWMGAKCGTLVPVVTGLDDRADEERLKALGAAAASSGSTAMFHVAGVTPESPSESDATGGASVPRLHLTSGDLRETRRRLGDSSRHLGAVSLGAPHLSAAALSRLASLVAGRETTVPFYVNTARNSLEEAGPAVVAILEGFGAALVTDTCTYITPIIGGVEGAVMTDSAKWAHYAPGNIGVGAILGDMVECVESAVAGTLVLDDPFGP